MARRRGVGAAIAPPAGGADEAEVAALLHHMPSGVSALLAQLLHGTGMRLLEGLRLQVKGVEFSRREIVVREGKGGKDRVTVLPENLIVSLQAH